MLFQNCFSVTNREVNLETSEPTLLNQLVEGKRAEFTSRKAWRDGEEFLATAWRIPTGERLHAPHAAVWRLTAARSPGLSALASVASESALLG